MCNYLAKHPIGIPRFAPYDTYLDAINAYQTDILFISEQRKDLIQENGLQGAPDVVIKILLPDTANYDLEEKMAVYARNG